MIRGVLLVGRVFRSQLSIFRLVLETGCFISWQSRSNVNYQVKDPPNKNQDPQVYDSCLEQYLKRAIGL